MVVEVLIIFLAFIALAAAIKSIFFIPWYLVVPAVVVLLVLYNGIILEGEKR
jgi:hypothetical protein